MGSLGNKLALFLGASLTTAGVAIQSVVLAEVAVDVKPSMILVALGIVSQAISAGFLAVSPQVRSGVRRLPIVDQERE